MTDYVMQFLIDRHNGDDTESYLDLVNGQTRDELLDFHMKHGKVWLGKVNLYDKDVGDLWPYVPESDPAWERDKHFVFNFGADFALPFQDKQLEQMVKDRAAREYTGTADDYELVTAIFGRIQEVGGIILTWA